MHLIALHGARALAGLCSQILELREKYVLKI